METNREGIYDDYSVITVIAEKSGARLDVFASGMLKDESGITRSAIKKLIESGDVLLNGKTSKASEKVKAGDSVTVTLPAPEEYDAAPENIPIDIVYEDNSIAVINKPKGMVVHPAPGNPSGTLVNALMYHIKNRQDDVGTFGHSQKRCRAYFLKRADKGAQCEKDIYSSRVRKYQRGRRKG